MLPRPLALVFGISCLPSAASAYEGVTPVKFFTSLKAGSPQTIVAYGTSLTASTAWVPLMKQWFDQQYPGKVTVFNGAQNGKNSEWGLANVQRQVIGREPDLVFIEFAVNDAKEGSNISVEQARSNLAAIMTAIRQANPRVEIVLLTMNDGLDVPGKKPAISTRPHLADYYAVYAQVAKEQQLPLVDLYPGWHALRGRDPRQFVAYAPDGLHPNEEGTTAVTWPVVLSFLTAAKHPAGQ